jgi:Undecaprenyl-phosphate galactose phosphotransferase WbaP
MSATSVIAKHDTPTFPRRNRWATLGSTVVSDVAALLISGFAAVLIRSFLSGSISSRCLLIIIPSICLLTVVYGLFGLYPGTAANPIEEFKSVMLATTITYLLIVCTTFFAKQALHYSRLTIVLAWLITTLCVPAARSVMRSWCSRQPWWGIQTVILGAGATGQAMLQMLEQRPTLGLRPVAVLDHLFGNALNVGHRSSRIFFGDLSFAPQFASNCRPCYAIIAMPHLESAQLAALIQEYADDFYQVLVIPDLFGIANLKVSAKDMAGVLALEISKNHAHPAPQIVKRCCDFSIALVMSALCLPIFLFICLQSHLNSSGPIFYGQRRIGRNAREFTAWKFRTMVMNADEVLEEYLRANPQLREEWEVDHKLKDDPRITPLGKFLRKFSLDELPQLWNVLCGQMSLVGPRPIVWSEVPRYGAKFALYRSVPPGITGLWQISGRSNTTYEERTRLDEYYVRHWSILLDLYILLCTFKTVLSAEGAY